MSTEFDVRLGRLLAAQSTIPPEQIDQLLKTVFEPARETTTDKTLADLVIEQQLLDRSVVERLSIAARDMVGAPEIPGYELISKIGEGAMGAVYKAKQLSMNRLVAIKVLAPHLARDDSFVQRFRREARSSAQLDHPHVVRGYDVGSANGHHYFVMEFVDGESVHQVLQRAGRLKVGDALRIVRDVADALVHAEQQKIVHRDIKPDNIMVTRRGTVKLADLGLAKQLDDDNTMTQTGSGFGTPYYMAPEQARNAKHVDGRSDIYALGVSFYRMLTGQVPFDGETAMEVLISKDRGTFPKPSSVNREVPPAVNLLIDKMMAKEPRHRHQSATELVAELDRIGMANATLSFIQGASRSRASTPEDTPPTRPKLTLPEKKGSNPFPQTKEKSMSANKTGEKLEKDLWFLRYKDAKGKLVKTKAYTTRIQKLLQEGELDDSVEASMTAQGPFKRLQAYPEFEPILRSRIAQKVADKKAGATATRMAHLLAHIDEEQQAHDRRRTLGNVWFMVSSIVLALVIVAGGGWAIWNYLIRPAVANEGLESQRIQKQIQQERERMGRAKPQG